MCPNNVIPIKMSSKLQTAFLSSRSAQKTLLLPIKSFVLVAAYHPYSQTVCDFVVAMVTTE